MKGLLGQRLATHKELVYFNIWMYRRDRCRIMIGFQGRIQDQVGTYRSKSTLWKENFQVPQQDGTTL
jgi:hypothetical protein